jgi:hypothetical protein
MSRSPKLHPPSFPAKSCTHFYFLLYVPQTPHITSSLLCLEKSTNHEDPHHASFSSLLFLPHIFLSNIFSNSLSLCSSFNLTDKVSHPYERSKMINVPRAICKHGILFTMQQLNLCVYKVSSRANTMH